MPSVRTLKLNLPHHWSGLKGLRAQISAWLADLDPALGEAAVMVASELAENALKYGEPSPRLAQPTLAVRRDATRLWLQVTSGASSGQAAALMARVNAIRGAADPCGLYAQRLRARLERRPVGGHSTGLGLYRICGEGEFALRCRPGRGVVTMRASRGLK